MKKLILNIFKKNFFIITVFNISFICSYFLESYSYGYILELVESRKFDFKTLAFVIIAVFFTIFICKLAISKTFTKLLTRLLQFRLDFSNKLNRIAMEKSFDNFEDYNFRAKINRAWNFFASDISGFQAVIIDMLYVFPSLILMIFSSVIIVQYSFFIVFISIFLQLFSYIQKEKLNEFDLNNDLEQGEIANKLEYYQNFGSKNECGKDIRIFSLSKIILEKYRDLYKEVTDILSNRIKLGKKLELSSLFFQILNDIVVFSILIWLRLYSNINISKIFTLFFMYQLFISKERDFLEKLSDFKANSKLFISYINELDSELELQKPNFEILKEFECFTVELKDVYFKYPNSDDFVLKNINMTFSSKEKIGLIGINGAGKSTLIKLIAGLYSPSKGNILINGKNLTENERLQFFSCVFQNSKFFAGTMCENLFATKTPSKKETEFVKMYLNKFNMDNVNGNKLSLDTKFGREFFQDAFVPSRGQEQIFTVLRALIKQDRMLILDEPTSFLDILNEAKFYNTLDIEKNSRGYLIISHRLAITNIVEKIYILNNGQIECFGTHTQLLEKSCVYRNLIETTQKMFFKSGEYHE